MTIYKMEGGNKNETIFINIFDSSFDNGNYGKKSLCEGNE